MSSVTTTIPRDRLVSSGRTFNPEDPYKGWPSYADLPLDPSYPTKAAWGVWVNANMKEAPRSAEKLTSYCRELMMSMVRLITSRSSPLNRPLQKRSGTEKLSIWIWNWPLSHDLSLQDASPLFTWSSLVPNPTTMLSRWTPRLPPS